jgi:hypothetical protein
MRRRRRRRPTSRPCPRTRGEKDEMSLRKRLEKHRCRCRCAPPAIPASIRSASAWRISMCLGLWRDKDVRGEAIDATGTLPSGESFTGPTELRTVLMKRKDQFARVLIEKMLAYALGRGVEAYDRPVIKEILQAVIKDGYRMDTVISAIATSYPFRLQPQSTARRPGGQQMNTHMADLPPDHAAWPWVRPSPSRCSTSCPSRPCTRPSPRSCRARPRSASRPSTCPMASTRTTGRPRPQVPWPSSPRSSRRSRRSRPRSPSSPDCRTSSPSPMTATMPRSQHGSPAPRSPRPPEPISIPAANRWISSLPSTSANTPACPPSS